MSIRKYDCLLSYLYNKVLFNEFVIQNCTKMPNYQRVALRIQFRLIQNSRRQLNQKYFLHILTSCLSFFWIVFIGTDRLQCLQHGQETSFYRKTTPHYRWFFWAGIKTIGAMMLPFGCNTSQPIPNILADNFFLKNGQVKFWPDNENVGSFLKKSDISLLQLVVNRNERC